MLPFTTEGKAHTKIISPCVKTASSERTASRFAKTNPRTRLTTRISRLNTTVTRSDCQNSGPVSTGPKFARPTQPQSLIKLAAPTSVSAIWNRLTIG